ncbi:Ig-like domain-containing protein [Wenyingzhuangia sp. IMCC45467]
MRKKNYFYTIILMCLFTLFGRTSLYAQEIYATSASELSTGNRVDNETNATANNDSFATVKSYGGFLLGGGAYAGELKLEFSSVVPANTTTYIRVDDGGTGLLDLLLGGSLGTALANVVGTIVLGDHYVEVSALDASNNNLLTGRSDNINSSSYLKVVRNQAGEVFFAITPIADYKSVVIKDNTNALLLGTTNFINVHHAFYLDPSSVICNPQGVFTSYDGSGITLDLLNLGGFGVNNPEHAIDNDANTYSEISVGVVSALASMSQNIEFATEAKTTDRLELNIRGREGVLVNVAVLQNVNIELLNDGIVVYTTTADAASLLTILPSAGGDVRRISVTPGVAFDALRVTLVSPLGVNIAQQVDLFGAQVTPAPPALTPAQETQSFCTVQNATVANLQATVTTGSVVWYNQETGGTAYNATDALVDGTVYYAATLDGSCESLSRVAVTVVISDTAVPTTTNITQSFCAVDNPTIANLSVNVDSGDITWYNQATGGTVYSNTDALVNGTKYYAANTVGSCESSTRLEITVEVNNPSVPTTTSINQSFCAINNPTIANLNATASGTLIWYNQAIGGTAYNNTDALVDGTTYYATNSDGGCESSTRLGITVVVNNPSTPTTTNATQSFCTVDNPTIADLNVTASGTVVWYNQSTGGTAYNNTDALANGITYYAANSDGGCESDTRLEVVVEIDDPSIPTTVNATQSFCAVDNPTIANLSATIATGTIVWYNQSTGGTAYNNTDALSDGIKYYAANVVGTCESSTRLEVTVVVNDTTTPSTANATQSFCAVDNPTVADLSATASGTLVWYNQPSGGTAYASTDALSDGTKYYAANNDGGCESSNRLEVTATVNDATTPTTANTMQSFCTVDNPTIADLNATASGTLVWYNQPSGGTAYASTDALSDDTKYYAANNDGGCESSSRLEVTAQVSNPSVPTTANTTQSFCAVDNPTIADLNATASGTLVWYNQATGGTVYASTDVLSNGIKYYAVNLDRGCESSSRLEVTAQVSNPSVPTTANATQSFCVVDNPTIADLSATASGTLVWYNQPSGGTAYASTDALSDGIKYYAANNDGGCESSSRLEVTVAMNDATTPTTVNGTQSFCAVANPTIADLSATSSGTLVWYNQASGGTAYASTDALSDGTTYYAANNDGTCESSNRLEVTAVVSNPSIPTTTNNIQSFCTTATPTIANLSATASGTIVWYSQATGGTAYTDTDLLIDGGLYYAANVDTGCEGTSRLEVEVILGEELLLTGEVADVCLGTTKTYELPSGLAPYSWNVEGGMIVSGGTTNDHTIEVQWTSLINTKIDVSVSGGCYLTSSKSFPIGVTGNCQTRSSDDLIINATVDNINPEIGEEITFTVTVVNTSNTSAFMNITVSEILTSGFTYVSNTSTMGTYSPSTGIWSIPSMIGRGGAQLTLTVSVNSSGNYLNTASLTGSTPQDASSGNNTVQILVEPTCLKIYNHMTPNGDGINDYLTISCIENYNNTVLRIFDRYGAIVYEQKNYKNNWDGVANKTSTIVNRGEQLANGTYFYHLELNNGSKPKTGWIQITK